MSHLRDAADRVGLPAAALTAGAGGRVPAAQAGCACGHAADSTRGQRGSRQADTTGCLSQGRRQGQACRQGDFYTQKNPYNLLSIELMLLALHLYSLP
eukprot:SM000069S20749  [mRNA]  locus=s69:552716:555688:- [translate_table: standard]